MDTRLVARLVVLGALVVAVLGLLMTCGTTRIGPGYVGIRVNLAGSTRGVEAAPAVTGWQFYNRWLTAIYEYPTFVQTAVWTREDTRQSPGNEEISFNSKEGMQITGDISLSYQLVADKVPAFFVEYRTDDLTTFTHGYLHNVARDLFNEVAGKYGVEEIYGPRKEEFTNEVRKRLNDRVNPKGVVIDQFGFIGAPRIPENVREALNAKVQATQDAMRAENQLREAQANARIAAAKAEGLKLATIQEAEGERQSKILRAQGEAEANRVLAASITQNLLEWRRLEISQQQVARWKGEVPQVQTGPGQGFLLQIPGKQ